MVRKPLLKMVIQKILVTKICQPEKPLSPKTIRGKTFSPKISKHQPRLKLAFSLGNSELVSASSMRRKQYLDLDVYIFYCI